jgi:hypothetical protein
MTKFKIIYIVFSLLTISCSNNNQINVNETSSSTEAIQEKAVTLTCNCFNGIGSRKGDSAIFEMKFSNGESISVCGFMDKEMEVTTFSEFNVFECSKGKSLTEYDAMQICRLIEKKDSLVIQELKYLPTGKNWTWNLIQIAEQIITVDDVKIFATPITPKLEKFYIDEQEAELFLNSLQKGKGHNDWELELGKLEVLALKGNEKAKYILENYEKFTGQETDGAVRETWSDAKATVEWIK